MLPAIHTPKIIAVSDREEWLKLRNTTIGGSESAALFESVTNESEIENEEDDIDFVEDGQSVSPYISPLALWALKTGRIQTVSSSNNRILWGTKMEPVIARTIAEKNGWIMRQPQGYYIHPKIDRMGASLDYEIDIDNSNVFIPFEIKNVADTERWKWKNAVGDWVVPLHIMIQVQHQLAVTGSAEARLGVLFGGSEERVFTIQRDEEIITELEEAIVDFWWYVENDVQPQPNLDRDVDIIKRLYIYTDPDNVLDWSDNDEAKNLIAKMKDLGSQANSLKKEADKIRQELNIMLGEASSAHLGDMVLKATVIEESEIKYKRQSYKKINTAKAKTKHSGRAIAQIINQQNTP